MDLKAMREAAGLSVIEVAKTLGVTRTAVYAWESGSFPRGNRLIQLAQLYNCTVDDLLGDRKEEAKLQ